VLRPGFAAADRAAGEPRLPEAAVDARWAPALAFAVFFAAMAAIHIRDPER
jgi:hypothetical protein